MSFHTIAVANTITATTTAETAVVTTPASDLPLQTDKGVKISGVLIFTTGAAATAVTIRVRQGVGTAGTVIGPATAIPATASATQPPFAFCVYDPNPGTNQQYTVTAQQTAATGNGTAVNACAEATGMWQQ